MPAPDNILTAVHELSEKSGYKFRVTDMPVEGTSLFVVYAENHVLPDAYTASVGVLGFRVPDNFPDACPEDCFFIQPHNVKLKQPDSIRRSTDVNRASSTLDFLKGTSLPDKTALVFSWHIWDRRPWNRNKYNLIDHYNHCVRRFDLQEHD